MKLRSKGLRNVTVQPDASGNLILPQQNGKFRVRMACVSIGPDTMFPAFDQQWYLQIVYGKVSRVAQIPTTLGLTGDTLQITWGEGLEQFRQATASGIVPGSNGTYTEILPLPVELIMDSQFTVQILYLLASSAVVSECEFLLEDYEEILDENP